MKKWQILIPSLVATTSMPLIGLVGCTKDNNSYVQVDECDGIHVEKTKIELNKDLVMHYRRDFGYKLEPQTSSITINREYHYVSDICDVTDDTITLPAQYVNSKKIKLSLNSSPKVTEFETDSWQTICDLVNLGEQKIIAKYECSSLNDLLGKERKVKINGFDHTVRLIGINHDKITGGQGKTALFTFEFKNTITKQINSGDIKPLQITYGAAASEVNYWQNLDHVLNSTTDDITWLNDANEKRSFYTMMAVENSGWMTNIKEVDRTVCVADSSALGEIKFTPTTKKTKLFQPCFTSYYSQQGIEAAGESFISSDGRKLYYEEDSQYELFQQTIGDSTPFNPEREGSFWSCLELLKPAAEGGDIYFGWWLSSPWFGEWRKAEAKPALIAKAPQYGAGVSLDLEVLEPDISQYSLAPCFCI